MSSSICQLVRELETNYTTGTVKLGEHIDWSMYDTIQKISDYLNSVHTSGKYDALGREKPFFNIVTAAVNIWYRATDIDRKDIRIIPSSSSEVTSTFVASVLLQKWMQENRFGKFLNKWGRMLAKYGSAVIKTIRKNGKLVFSVVPFYRLIVDPIDFSSSPVVERLFFTPSQLLDRKEFDQDAVKLLIEKHKESRKMLDNQSVDNYSEFIEAYEVHYEFPLSFLTGEEKDEEIYRQQMYVVSFIESGENEGGKEFNDFVLYKGKEEKSPYRMTHLIEEEGRSLSIGAVEYLFDAQWMVNHTIKQQKDYLDLASMIIFQTADVHFVNRNVFSAIQNGDILIHQQNQPLTQVSNMAGNISASQAFSAQWQNLSREITSTPDAVRGNTMPSGTPYSLGAILSENAGSLFEIMVENKALDLEDMVREDIIPFIKTQMDTSKEITAILDDYNITQIDSIYIPSEAVRLYNKKSLDAILNDEIPSPFNQGEEESMVMKNLAPLGNTRFLKPSEISSKTWKEVLKDFEWNVRVEIANEATDKRAVLQTLSSLYMTTAKTDPVKANLILGKILTETGAVSPLEFKSPIFSPSPSLPPKGEVAPLLG